MNAEWRAFYVHLKQILANMSGCLWCVTGQKGDYEKEIPAVKERKGQGEIMY